MDMLLLVIIGSELILDRKNHIIINIKNYLYTQWISRCSAAARE